MQLALANLRNNQAWSRGTESSSITGSPLTTFLICINVASRFSVMFSAVRIANQPYIKLETPRRPAARIA